MGGDAWQVTGSIGTGPGGIIIPDRGPESTQATEPPTHAATAAANRRAGEKNRRA